MKTRLTSKIWVDALVRRVNVVGASAYVLQKGDEERGDVLVKVAKLDQTASLYTPTINMEGERVFLDLIVLGVGPDVATIDTYIARAKIRDRDLWIVEIEDREGRHFLTEKVQST